MLAQPVCERPVTRKRTGITFSGPATCRRETRLMPLKRLLFAPALLGLALISLAACGGSGAGAAATTAPSTAATAPSDVRVTLSDLKLESNVSSFEKGRTYRITVENKGKLAHEWSVAPRGGMSHDAMLQSIGQDQLPPGAKVTVDYAFPSGVSGPLEFACHLPGHYEAGMRLDISVK